MRAGPLAARRRENAGVFVFLAGRTPWKRLVAAVLAIALLIPNNSVLELRPIVAVFLVCLFTGRARTFARDWLPLVAAAAAFVLIRQFAVLSPLPHQGVHVSQIEVAAFGGELPSAWLQELVSGGPSPVPGLLNYGATAIHASYFFGFVVVGLGTWLLDRQRFATYTQLLAAVFALGLLGYFLAPTEPPWLIARAGLTAPAKRVMTETARGTRLTAGLVAAGQAWQHDPDALGDPNPTAAMPSVHTAVTVALALFLSRYSRALAVAGWLYVAAMGFSLVYLGEHYVLDVAAGAACAVVAALIAGVLHRSDASRPRVAGPYRTLAPSVLPQLARRALVAARVGASRAVDSSP